jgi:hypothetical protein
MTFLNVYENEAPDLEVLAGDVHPGGEHRTVHLGSKLPSFTLLFILWIGGLAAWFYFIVSTNKITFEGKKKNRKAPSKDNTYKDK